MPYIQGENNNSISLTVHVQPKSSKNRIAGLHGDAVKICITAPPVDGKANSALIVFLAKFFNIPKSAVTLKSGKQSRTKRFLLSGLSPAEAKTLLQAALQE